MKFICLNVDTSCHFRSPRTFYSASSCCLGRAWGHQRQYLLRAAHMQVSLMPYAV